MNGKGDKNRTTDVKAFGDNYDQIDWHREKKEESKVYIWSEGHRKYIENEIDPLPEEEKKKFVCYYCRQKNNCEFAWDQWNYCSSGNPAIQDCIMDK